MMSAFRRLSAGLSTLILISACAHNQQTEPTSQPFRHDMASEVTPWTHESFDNAEDKFSFALFSDLTGGEREGIFEVAVEQLRLCCGQN